MPSVKDQQQGSVYQRADGQWTGSIELGRDASGKRIRKVVYGRDERHVRYRLETFLSRRTEGAILTTAEEHYADFLPRWFLTLRPRPQGKYSPTTLHGYRGLMERYLIPRIGHVAVGELNADHVEDLQEGMLNAGLSSQTVLNTRNLLRVAVRYAMRRRLLTSDPFALVEAPPASRGTGRALEPHEAQRFMAAIKDDRLEAAFLLELALGLRRSEVLGLTWPAIDLAAGQLHVRQGLHQRAGMGIFLTEPKSKRSNRVLGLPRRVTEALRARWEQRLRDEALAAERWRDDQGYVFCGPFGGLPSPDSYSDALKAALRKAGLHDIRGHDLRHSASSILQAMGLPPLAAMGVLGHSSPQMTMGIYGHMLDASRLQAATLMDQYLDEVSSS